MSNFTVTVDGHALWYLLRRLETYLENECPSGVELEQFKSRGFEAQEFSIIKAMQEQITKEYK